MVGDLSFGNLLGPFSTNEAASKGCESAKSVAEIGFCFLVFLFLASIIHRSVDRLMIAVVVVVLATDTAGRTSESS